MAKIKKIIVALIISIICIGASMISNDLIVVKAKEEDDDEDVVADKATYYGKEIKQSDLEGQNDYSRKTLDKLQSAAKDAEDIYFNFDAKELLKNAAENGKFQGSEYGVDNNYYYYDGRNCMCTTPESNHGTWAQEPTCIITMDGAGNVRIDTIVKDGGTGQGGKVKTYEYSYESDPAFVKEAYKTAYYAAMSTSNKEGQFSFTGTPYKDMLRFGSFLQHQSMWTSRGFPSYFYGGHDASSMNVYKRRETDSIATKYINDAFNDKCCLPEARIIWMRGWGWVNRCKRWR